MKLWPMNDGFLFIFEIEGDFDIIGHESRQIDFANLDNICNERTANA